MNSNLSQTRPPVILLVEDNKMDVFLTRKSFKRANFAVNLQHVSNGEQCLAFLRKEGKYANAPTPDLILLDLNLPIMDGRELLAELVKDDKLNHLPVIILTTSKNEYDILTMYKLRCSAYISKPVDFNEFQEVIEKMISFWFTVVVLPPKA